MASLTHELSLSILTFSSAGTSELNIVYLLSFVTGLPRISIAWSFV